MSSHTLFFIRGRGLPPPQHQHAVQDDTNHHQQQQQRSRHNRPRPPGVEGTGSRSARVGEWVAATVARGGGGNRGQQREEEDNEEEVQPSAPAETEVRDDEAERRAARREARHQQQQMLLQQQQQQQQQHSHRRRPRANQRRRHSHHDAGHLQQQQQQHADNEDSPFEELPLRTRMSCLQSRRGERRNNAGGTREKKDGMTIKRKLLLFTQGVCQGYIFPSSFSLPSLFASPSAIWRQRGEKSPSGVSQSPSSLEEDRIV